MKTQGANNMRVISRSIMGGAFVVLGLGFVPSGATAQRLANDDAVLRQIWNEGMNNSHFESLSQSLLDSIGPRLTASPGIERAQDWAIKTLQGWGIEAEREQYGTWEGWDRGVSHIDLISPRVRSLEGRILAWSPGTGGRPVEGEVSYLPEIDSPADWETFLGTVRGKWVMLSFPQPTCRTNEQWAEFAMEGSAQRMAQERTIAQRRWDESLAATGSTDRRRRDLHAQLEEAGAAGIVTSQWPGSYGTTRVFNAYNRESPTFELGCEDYGLVYRLAANGQNPILRVTAEAENRGEVPVFNVIGEIPGTVWPDQYVMLSAHFDSWEGGSGATDNGAGAVLMLATMRRIQEAYPDPKGTNPIGLGSGEEQGLNGSRAYTEDHPEVVEGLQALWNQDNGTGRIVNLSAQGLVEAGGSLAKWLSQVPQEVSQYVDLNLPGTPGGGALPLGTGPIAVSREPKWKLRQADSSQEMSTEPFRTVSVDGARSAEPPTSSGTASAIAFNTAPEAARVANFSPASNAGKASVQLPGNSPASILRSSAASSGWAAE